MPPANGGGSPTSVLLRSDLPSGNRLRPAGGPRGVEGVSYMRQDRGFRRGVRANALWGRRGESRSNALWGSGKRGIFTIDEKLVIKRIGRLTTADAEQLERSLRQWLGFQ